MMRMKNHRLLLNHDWVFGTALFAVTLIAFWPAINGTPVWDDEANITAPVLRSPAGLFLIWTHLGATQQYYPLVHTVWWLEHLLWGDRTTGNHLLNILLHVFSALLLAKLLRKLNVPGPRLAAAIFALHPVLVESVAWITELKNTLSGVFFFGAALAFLGYSEKRERRLYVVALGLFILGLTAKTAIAPFPLAMLAIVWWKRGTLSWKHDCAPMIPFVMAGIAFGLVTSYVERTFLGAEGHEFHLSLMERCLVAGRAFWFYLCKIFLPVNLMFVYPRWRVSGGTWWLYLFPAAALMAATAVWALRRRWRAPLATFLYFTAMILPVLGFVNVFAFKFSFVADHWQYLAAAGPITLAAAGMTSGLDLLKKESRRLLQPVFCAVLLSALGALSWKQSAKFADAETLYRDVIMKNPACWMAHNNLGILLAGTNRTEEAIGHYRTALEINPDFVPAHYNLAVLLRQTGRIDEAKGHFEKALKNRPHDAKSYFLLGNALMQSGRMSEGIAYYRMTLAINPGHLDASLNLGCALMLTGQTDEAIVQFKKAQEINPSDTRVLKRLRAALLQTGRTDEVIQAEKKALDAARSSGRETLARALEADIETLGRTAKLPGEKSPEQVR
jgi:protein O-mannosyl-transferase